jgi:molybdopterin converting factor subunit 1
MTVTVRLFARARELAGGDAVRVTLPAGATVGQMRERLARECPALAGLLPRCVVAVDAEFAEDGMNLRESSEVALIPPVSGG